MNGFGEFLYTLRKEKGMTQAELAAAVGVTNKAVSKWETGEAMPEAALLLPLSEILGVSVDELLKGKRNTATQADNKERPEESDPVKQYMFTRGKDDEDENKTLSEKIRGAVCGAVVLLGIAVYLFLGAFAELWHPYWIIIPACALLCGIIGIVFDLCNREKRIEKTERGENPYVGGICGIVFLSCVIAYLFLGAFTGLWHPLWIIVVGGALFCGIAGSIGGIITHKKDK